MKKRTLLLVSLLSASILTGCGNGQTSSSATPEVSSPESSSPSISSTTSSLPAAATMVSKAVDLYASSTTTKYPLNLYFRKDGASDLPFVKLDSDITSLIGGLLAYGQTRLFTASSADNKVTISNPNGYKAVVDFQTKKVTYDDFTSFNAYDFAMNPLDNLADSGFDTDGKPAYYEREKSSSYYLRGERDARVFDLGAYNIPMVYEENCGYLPLATFNDLFLGVVNGSLVYNGTAAFYYGDFSQVKDAYYTATPTGKISQELATFSYNELCFNFDSFYGLFNKRGLTSFDDYFNRMGYKTDMLSTNTLTLETAAAKAMFQGFCEGHSGFIYSSAYTGTSFSPLDSKFYGPSFANQSRIASEFSAARKTGLGDDYKAYEEVNGTAYITFDQFKSHYGDYYNEPVTSVTQASDTVALVEYAHKKIQADNIQNVVVDLSNNGGGELNAAIYLAYWMSGHAELSMVESVTGAKGTSIYKCDVNMDRKFDESDTLVGKNVYCLVSPCSFSCGNLVPFMLKSVGNVALVGQHTGGGACVVSKLNSAVGETGQVSGHRVISYLKNGIYQDVDGGVDPDFWLKDKASYYDRSALSTYLASLK